MANPTVCIGQVFGPLARRISAPSTSMDSSARRTARTSWSSLPPCMTSGTWRRMRFARQRSTSRNGVMSTMSSTERPSMNVAG